MTSASVLTWATSRQEFRPLSAYNWTLMNTSSVMEDVKSPEMTVPDEGRPVLNPTKTRGKRKGPLLKVLSSSLSRSSTTASPPSPVKITHSSLPAVISHPLPRPKVPNQEPADFLATGKDIGKEPTDRHNNNNEERDINVEDDESNSAADDDQPEDLSVRKRDQQCQTEIPYDVKREILASIMDQGLARGVLATLISNRPRLKADTDVNTTPTVEVEPLNPKPEGSIAPSPSTSKSSVVDDPKGTSDIRLKELYLTTLNFLLLRTRKLLQSSSSSSSSSSISTPTSVDGASLLRSRSLQESVSGSRLQPVCVSSKSKREKCTNQGLCPGTQQLPLSPSHQTRVPRLSLEDLLRTSHPEGLLRNVSLNQGFSQAHTLNDSFPLPGSGDQSSNSDLAFGASNLANLTSTANTQTTAEGQSAGEAPFGITDTEIIKEIFNVFGGRDLHEVENWAPIDGSSTSFSSAKSGNSSSLSTNNGRQQHRNDLSASSSTTAQGSIRHESLGEDPYCNGSVTPTFDNGSMTPSPYAAAMLSAATIPGYSGYNPYLAAATGRYPPTAATPYTPLMNHSYAAVAAAASLTPSQSTTLGASSSSGAMALDDLDSASHTSGKSSMSKDFNFDPSSIKQEPEEFSSSSCGSGIGRSRQCRDEKKARELGVTFSIDDIINLPMDEFNDMLSRQELTEEQLNLCRDIRRRGKNKVAAQNCRKRKIDQIAQLEEEVHRARTRKQNLLMERETLFRQRDEWRSKLMGVEEDILSEMGRNTKEFRLDFGAPDVRILRRDELMVGRQSSAVDHLETNRYAQTGPNSSADTSQHPNFNWKSDSNQHS